MTTGFEHSQNPTHFETIMGETTMRHRVTPQEFERMYLAGVFESGLRLELINGEIVEMAAMLDPHVALLARLNRALIVHLPEPSDVVCQVPVVLYSSQSQPEPDFVITRARIKGKPRAEEIALLIEVSDSTLSYDRKTKQSIYAKAGIPEYWIINLTKQPYKLEVYQEPQGEEYRSRKLYSQGEKVAPLEWPSIPLEWW
jgi:Uma2 family endonuclease